MDVPAPDRSPAASTGLARRDGPRALLARHPLGVFLGWFFTAGQATVFVPVVARGVAGGELPREPFIIAATLVGLLLPALVITSVVEGRPGLRRLLRSAVRVRVPLGWYALAVVAVPLVTVLVTAAPAGPPGALTAAGLVDAVAVGLLVQLAVVFVTVNWSEEVAWTGFVQARLSQRHGPVRAAVLTSPLFALGHVSAAFDHTPLAGMLVMLLLLVLVVPMRLLLGWVHSRSGSLFLVGLVHAAGNAAALGSLLGAGLVPRLYGQAGQSAVAFALLGLAVLATTRGRLGDRA